MTHARDEKAAVPCLEVFLYGYPWLKISWCKHLVGNIRRGGGVVCSVLRLVVENFSLEYDPFGGEMFFFVPVQLQRYAMYIPW